MKTKKPRSKSAAKPEPKDEGIFAAIKGLITREITREEEAPKATALLEKQHRKVEALFSAIESANGDARALVRELATDLLAHMVIEEKLFYPVALKFKEGLVLEGYEEHVVSRYALERLLAASPKDRSFTAKAKTLKDIILDHAKEEERELFPKVEKEMSADALRGLGAKMKRLFDQTVAAGWEKTLGAEGPKVPARALGANGRGAGSARARSPRAAAS